jgi:hypothetical protein
LRPIAVSDDELVTRKNERRERRNSFANVLALGLHRHGLAAPEKRVATERSHDPHCLRLR